MDLLTQNALTRILSGEQIPNPVVQIMAYKLVPQAGEERFRLLASDGVKTYQYLMAMSPKVVEEVKKGVFEKFTIVRLDNYLVNDISNKRIIIVEDATVLKRGAEIGRTIGNPTAIQQTDISELMTQPTGGVLQRNGLTGNFNQPPRPQQPPTNSMPPPAPQPFFNQTAQVNNKPSFGGGYGQSQSQSSTANKTIDKNRVVPINTVTPYIPKWVIKARCMAKRDKRTWSNAKGEGTVFSFDVTDDSGEIRITCFKNEVDRFYDLIEPNRVYYIANGSLKVRDTRYGLPGTEYEITLNNDSLIEPCVDEQDAPKIRYNFKPIEAIGNLSENEAVDVMGIVKDVGPLDSIVVKRTNTEMNKRDVTLFDKSQHEIRLTLWGVDAQNFNIPIGAVAAVKGARVKLFGGHCLTGGTIAPNPENAESFSLKAWYNKEGQHAATKSLTESGGGMGGSAPLGFTGELNLGNISKAKDEKMSASILGNVLSVRRANLYKGCQTCNRKLEDNGSGFYRCNKCNKEASEFNWRLIATLQVADASSCIYVTVFPDQFKEILSRDLDELLNSLNGDQDRLTTILSGDLNFKNYLFKIRATAEHYNEERRSKHIANTIKPVSHRFENKMALSQIRSLKPF